MERRLIDANALKERILLERDKIPLFVPAAVYELARRKPNQHGNAMRGGIRVALRCMEQTPSVDAVEVVRCKDCKYFKFGDYCYHDGVMEHSHACEDDYCSYGVRREPDGE